MKLLFACGGSGGHIFPAMAVADEILGKNPDHSVVFVSSGKAIEGEIFKSMRSQRVRPIQNDSPANVSPLWHPRFLLRLAKEIRSAALILKEEKPDRVVGFGGHGSFAIVLAARWMRIPVFLHEQNVVPGLANRVLAFFVNGAAISFKETRLWARRLCLTGNPIRPAIERDCRDEAMDFFGFLKEKKTLLILGGSQGAESVNTLFFEALPHLSESFKSGVQVLHLCGRMKAEESEARMKYAGLKARAFSFFDRMELAYGAADAVVGRAGATFLAEMEARGIPAILIPYPYAGGHQLENARIVGKRCNALIAEQKTLSGQKLAQLIMSRFSGERSLVRRGQLPPDPAREKLADFILTRS